MSQTIPPSNDAAATRLAIAWEIVRCSGIDASERHHLANLVGDLARAMLVREQPSPLVSGRVRLSGLEPASIRVKAGEIATIAYRWSGSTSGPMRVFVHLCDSEDRVILGDDHGPATPTHEWSGIVEYSRAVLLPRHLAPGVLSVNVGMYDVGGVGTRLPIEPGPGAALSGHDRVRIGVIEVV